MKTEKYQVCIYDPVRRRNSFLNHRDKIEWSKRTAQKHADDIRKTWAANMIVTLIKA